MSMIDARREQMFPKLTPGELARLRRFGEVRRYTAGEQLFKTGDPSPGMFVLITGNVTVSRRDGLGHIVPVIEQGPGEFLAEVGQLSGQPALLDGVAKTDVEALLIPTEGLRALLIAEAELGERIMRALILRRVALRDRRRRPSADRAGHQPRLDTPAGLPRPQWLSASGARSGRGC